MLTSYAFFTYCPPRSRGLHSSGLFQAKTVGTHLSFHYSGSTSCQCCQLIPGCSLVLFMPLSSYPGLQEATVISFLFKSLHNWPQFTFSNLIIGSHPLQPLVFCSRELAPLFLYLLSLVQCLVPGRYLISVSPLKGPFKNKPCTFLCIIFLAAFLLLEVPLLCNCPWMLYL